MQRAAAEKCSAGVGSGIYAVRSFAPRIVLSGRRSRSSLPCSYIFEAVALALGLKYVAAVREPIEGGEEGGLRAAQSCRGVWLVGREGGEECAGMDCR